MKSKEIIEKLNLIPHPEGGYYRETFRALEQVELQGKQYVAGTSIYYLLRSNAQTQDFSAWHKIHDLDETWYYHAGDDLTLFYIDTQGNLVTKKLGLGANAEPQVYIPKDTWFAALVENPDSAAYCLVGCAVFPGFDFSCFELGKQEELVKMYPQHRQLIEKLTRNPEDF